MRGWAVSPDFATIVAAAIRDRHPNVVVELGSGVSTLIMGYCLDDLGQGRLISIEHDEAHAARSRDAVARHGLGHVVTIAHAPLADVEVDGRTYRWYKLPELPDRIDVLIVDGPPATHDPQARYPALPLLMDRLRDAALILVDDGARRGEREMVARWAERFPLVTVEFQATEKGAYLLRVRRTTP
jgi:predicted O-methyltransferase YrrM